MLKLKYGLWMVAVGALLMPAVTGMAVAQGEKACLKACKKSDDECVNCSSAYYYNDRNPNYYNEEVKACKDVYDKIGRSSQ